jgi:hypothetical protein
MPTSLPVPTPVAARERHCTGIAITLPPGGPITLVASFSIVEKDAPGTMLSVVAESSVTLSDAEVRALPAFGGAYAQLSAAVHAKRNSYNP